MTIATRKPRKAAASVSLAAVAVAAISLTPLNAAQPVPEDLTVMPPVPDDYTPSRTEWGDPDLRGVYPIDNIASLPLQRPRQYGDRFWLTDQEYAQRAEQANRSAEAYKAEEESGKMGMGHWVESDASGRRTSLLVEPANGQLPAFTPKGEELYKAGRSSWNQHPFDWVDDFDSWDRCVSRGFPASMLPFRYNNGIRVFQAPGVVVIDLEMIHDSRIIHVAGNKAEYEELKKTRWPNNVRTWMGQSLGYWEDANTLVVETTNIKAGDSVAEDTSKRAASPLNMATIGVPPNNTIPMSEKAAVLEKLHMTGPNSIVYEMTYSDPETFVAPWTARLDWTRNDDYGFFEYACHEGNVQVRNYINASRAERGLSTSGVGTHSANTAPDEQ